MNTRYSELRNQSCISEHPTETFERMHCIIDSGLASSLSFSCCSTVRRSLASLEAFFYGALPCALLVSKVKALSPYKEARQILRAVFHGTRCLASRVMGFFRRTRFRDIFPLALLRAEPDFAA